ncbi:MULTISPECIES: hypothetical protein [unclassified Campylobacter]|uniref:hypothetical protein n=1 Tax=unclassified Campylobacter TaxID=2593542 RepID=UPI00147319D3|nr:MULTISPECIES: hypothetical protein [unclassified Campylobacter]QKG30164.1 hypothetical protein CDOMF_1938 [Campylobacter sp. RM16187]
MPVTPIGNTIFINQNMNIVSNKQAEVQNRFDLQNLAAMTLNDEKNEEVAQVRPTEETYKIDPQHQHEKSKSDQEESVFDDEEQKKLSDKETDDDGNIEDEEERPILDIKI